MVSGDKNYTRGGNVRAPTKVTCLQWVAKAWEMVTEDVIQKSFQSCGISVKTDGSEDADIHFLKSSGIADAAREIAQCTAGIEANKTDSDEDPFADVDEDDEQLDMNEIVIDEDEN